MVRVTPSIAAQAIALFAENKSLRKISIQLGISRATVTGLVRGTITPSDGNDERASPDQHGLVPFKEDAPYEVCPVCKHPVKMPCYLCQVRALRLPAEEREAIMSKLTRRGAVR